MTIRDKLLDNNICIVYTIYIYNIYKIYTNNKNMSEKVYYGFNMDLKTREELKIAANKKFMKVGPLINSIIDEWLKDFTRDDKVREDVKAKSMDESLNVVELNKEYFKKHPVNQNHVTPANFDKVDLGSGNPKPEFID